MDKKTLIKTIKCILNDKTFNVEEFNVACKQFKDLGAELADWEKLLNKTLLTSVIKSKDSSKICSIGMLTWEINPSLWDTFSGIFYRTHSSHTNKIYNDMICLGEPPIHQLVADNSGLLKISGSFDNHNPDMDSEISIQQAKKLAFYPGSISIHVKSISPEVAAILSHRKGHTEIAAMWSKYDGVTSIPDDNETLEFIENVVRNFPEGYDLIITAEKMSSKVAEALGDNIRPYTLRLDCLSHLSVGVAKGLSYHTQDTDSRYSYLSIGCTPLVRAPGALEEFRRLVGELQIKGIDDLKMSEAKALAEHKGNLSIGLTEWPDMEVLSELVKTKYKLSVWFGSEPDISTETAKVLTQYKGEELYINGIGNLEDEAVSVLRALGSRLSLVNIESISEKSVSVLEEDGVNTRPI